MEVSMRAKGRRALIALGSIMVLAPLTLMVSITRPSAFALAETIDADPVASTPTLNASNLTA
jgi:hypothetical protein